MVMPVQDDGDNALYRMVVPARDGPGRLAGHVHDALETAVGKAARSMFDVSASFRAQPASRLSRGDLLAALPQPLLAWPLPARRAPFGLLVLDALLVNALVELATNAPDTLVFRDRRNPTAIDAALCQPYCAQLLDLLSGAFSDDTCLPDLPALSPEHHETDQRRLTYQLDPGDHDMFSGEVTFQEGVRGGVMIVAFPVSFRKAPAADADPRPGWKRALEAGVAMAPLALRADIEQIEMPLSRLLALARGDLLPISANALGDVSLVAGDGRILMKGKLGQKGRRKAIAVTENRLSPDIASPHIDRGDLSAPRDPPDRPADMPRPPPPEGP